MEKKRLVIGYRVEPTGRISGFYMRVKSDVILELFGSLLVGSKITQILHF